MNLHGQEVVKKPGKPRWGCAAYGDGDDTGVTEVTSRVSAMIKNSTQSTPQTCVTSGTFRLLCLIEDSRLVTAPRTLCSQQ